MANEESPSRGRTGFLNCFLNQKDEPTNQVKEEASSYFKTFGPHTIAWKKSELDKWFASVKFTEASDCEDCIAKSRQKKPSLAGVKANIKKSRKRPGEFSSPFGKPLKEVNYLNSASSMPLSSLHCQNLNDEDPTLKILWSMHKYGQSKKQKEWKEIAVILVLPESKYKEIKATSTTKLLSENLLDKYARTAVPSRYVSSLDHCEDEYKLVVHAEAKLVGDPKRHPSRLAVPYDRSCLVQLITEYRKSEWLNGRSVDEFTKSFKVFLYSEEVVCKFCLDAIFDSLFYNLVEKGFCNTDEFIPVIGYNFSTEDIDTWKIKERLQFYGPRSTIPDDANRSDSPVAAKRNLNEDLENVTTQARTPVKEGGDA